MKRLARLRLWMLSIGLVLLLALSSGGLTLAATTSIAQTLTGITTQGTRLEPISIMSWSHEVKTAREAGSGLATGRRQYQPLLIRKRIDKATPLLMKALVQNETFRTLTLSIDEMGAGGGGGAGKPSNVMTITLTNAQIVGITHGGDCDDDCDGLTAEDVSFTYQKIEWSAGGAVWTDDWLAPAVTDESSAMTYFMAINEKGVPGRPKKQTQVSAHRTQIISPRDAASGLPTGKRQHKPFILAVPNASDAPELMTAFLTGRPIERLSVFGYSPEEIRSGAAARSAINLVGVQVVSMTDNRRVSSFDPLMLDLSGDGNCVVFELVYQKIEWLNATGGVTHEDTWDQQR